MNPSDSSSRSSAAIHSEIADTRHRMDNTIDALSRRLEGRHLADEVIGYFRRDGKARHLKDEVMESAGSALHKAVDTAKAHPIPSLLIGAGLAWLAYEAKEAGREDDGEPGAMERGAQKVQAKAGELKDKVVERSGEMADRARGAVENVRERAREGAAHVRQQAAQAATQVRDGTRRIARRTGRKVVRATREHPLETGFACLALGLVAGLLAPTAEGLREIAEPVGEKVRDRVRDTGRDLAEKGGRVAQAAMSAARDEAEKEGLTTGDNGGKGAHDTPAPTGSQASVGQDAEPANSNAPAANIPSQA